MNARAEIARLSLHSIPSFMTTEVYLNNLPVPMQNIKVQEDAIRFTWLSITYTNREKLVQRDELEFTSTEGMQLLVDVYKNIDKFAHEQVKVSVLCRLNPQRTSGPSILEYEVFLEKWNRFSSNLFKGMDWNNLVVAGGSITSCITGSDSPSSDIDLFIYGLDVNSANKKIQQVFNTIQTNLGRIVLSSIYLKR